jgi:hypothetical protein
VEPQNRPLPDCITRLLDAGLPPARARRPAAPAKRRVRPPTGRGAAHGVLESLVLRGFVYGVSALVWMLVIGLMLRHATR